MFNLKKVARLEAELAEREALIRSKDLALVHLNQNDAVQLEKIRILVLRNTVLARENEILKEKKGKVKVAKLVGKDPKSGKFIKAK